MALSLRMAKKLNKSLRRVLLVIRAERIGLGFWCFVNFFWGKSAIFIWLRPVTPTIGSSNPEWVTNLNTKNARIAEATNNPFDCLISKFLFFRSCLGQTSGPLQYPQMNPYFYALNARITWAACLLLPTMTRLLSRTFGSNSNSGGPIYGSAKRGS